MNPSFREEAGHTIRLAIPLVIGQATNVAMVFVDTLFAGRLGAEELAAVAIGGTIWASANLLVLGTLLAVPAFVSQFDGAGERQRIGPFARQVAWVVLLMAALIFTVVRSVDPVLTAIGIPEEVRPLANGYLYAIAWGAPFYACFFLCRFVSEGVGRMRPAMILGFGGLALNIFADWGVHVRQVRGSGDGRTRLRLRNRPGAVRAVRRDGRVAAHRAPRTAISESSRVSIVLAWPMPRRFSGWACRSAWPSSSRAACSSARRC